MVTGDTSVKEGGPSLAASQSVVGGKPSSAVERGCPTAVGVGGGAAVAGDSPGGGRGAGLAQGPSQLSILNSTLHKIWRRGSFCLFLFLLREK